MYICILYFINSNLNSIFCSTKKVILNCRTKVTQMSTRIILEIISVLPYGDVN